MPKKNAPAIDVIREIQSIIMTKVLSSIASPTFFLSTVLKKWSRSEILATLGDQDVPSAT